MHSTWPCKYLNMWTCKNCHQDTILRPIPQNMLQKEKTKKTKIHQEYLSTINHHNHVRVSREFDNF